MAGTRPSMLRIKQRNAPEVLKRFYQRTQAVCDFCAEQNSRHIYTLATFMQPEQFQAIVHAADYKT